MEDAPKVPAGRLVYAIGDIHGRADLLDRLLRDIELDAAAIHGVARRTLVFVGDYVDRGPDSRGVVDRLLTGPPSGFDAVFLRGNHEAFLLDFLRRPDALSLWLYNGAAETLASYGLDVSDTALRQADAGTWRDRFVERLPQDHRAFYEALALSAVIGDYLFVHAGVRPGVPLDRQDPGDLMWIREAFLESRRSFGHMVVHGHTPGSEPVTRPNRIGIDTGAWMTGRLTALRLWGTQRRFLTTAGA